MLLALLVVAALGAPAHGEESPGAGAPSPEAAEPKASPAPTPIAGPNLTEIGRQAEQVASQLRDMSEALMDPSALAEIEDTVSNATNRVDTRWGETERLLGAAPRRTALESQDSAWRALRADLAKLREQVNTRDRAREADQKSLARLRESWERMLDLARGSGAPDLVVTRAEQTLAAIDATRVQVDARRNRTLVLQDAVSRAMQGCDDAVARIKGATRAAVERVFVRDAPPLWAIDHLFADPRTGVTHGERLRASVRTGIEDIVAYGHAYRVAFAFTALLMLFLAVVLRRARARVELRSVSDPALAPAVPVFLAPHAAALVVALVITIPLRPNPPVALRSLLLFVGLPAVLALLRPLLDRRLLSSVYALAVLFALELVRDLLQVTPGLEQLLLVVEMGAATAVLLRAASQLLASAGENAFHSPWIAKAAAGVLRPLALAAAVAALAALVGYLELADFVGAPAILLGYAAFVAIVFRAAADGLLALALGMGFDAGLRVVQRYRALIERRIRWFLDALATLMWIRMALDRFELEGPAYGLVLGILDARLQVGDLDVSVGHMLGLPVVLLTGYLLTRAVVFVLEEDVYSRMALPRGVPYALSTLTRYGLLLVSFFLALGTLGLDLTRLTVLVSAFGLGIGFGLQQVVNNFVSGLILLFERPVQVGDAVQLSDTLGKVTRIGIRSSTIRTLDGAEVIVPNATIIEEKLINWTLSDSRRRIIVDVGVSYGTDAAEMITLLLNLARQNPQVAKTPEPDAIFVAFGESSLDFQLRVWTDSPDWLGLRSELGVALQRALREAGIEVPFPQRDVHVRSVDGGVPPRADTPAVPHGNKV